MERHFGGFSGRPLSPSILLTPTLCTDPIRRINAFASAKPRMRDWRLTPQFIESYRFPVVITEQNKTFNCLPAAASIANI
jgi:hypothetical protein